MIGVRLLGLAAMVSALACVSTSAASSYGWPFRPFNKQHPIRGFFGDPRTVYEDRVLARGFEKSGSFSFHQGVDISAANGTPIYSVVSGVAHYLGTATLSIRARGDRIFQYFHIVPNVDEGQQVVAQQTMLGFVQTPFGHVHLTEIDGTHSVNPLQEGHLSPYNDHTRPTVRAALFRNQTGWLQAPLRLCGHVEIAADAFDTPPLPSPGAFFGFPVAPALVRWNINRQSSTVAGPWHTAADFRSTLPPNRHFFDIYAQGTYENAPRFGDRQYPLMPGRYLFLLAANFDTTSLPNGAYTLAILAADERANTVILQQPFTVLNTRTDDCPNSPALPNRASNTAATDHPEQKLGEREVSKNAAPSPHSRPIRPATPSTPRPTATASTHSNSAADAQSAPGTNLRDRVGADSSRESSRDIPPAWASVRE